MKYVYNYKDTTEMFLDRIRFDGVFKGVASANSWLWEFDESKLTEAERLNVILPLIKWCAENDQMCDELEDELYLYYEDYSNGKLAGILDETEAADIVRDLSWAYHKVFDNA